MANTIRGKILLAFCALAAITGFLGVYAVDSVVQSGHLVVETYDKPLMAISYARLALSNFIAMELTLAQRQSAADPARRRQLDIRVEELGSALQEDLAVAEERSMSLPAAAVARATARAAAGWDALRRRVIAGDGSEAERAALDERAAAVVDSFDSLVELTAEDGFRDRERALASIESFRRVGIAGTLLALFLGAIVAILLARRMVRPIAVASAAARRIAEGELEVDIVSAGGDELGQLLASMAVMRDNIRAIMQREIAARRSAQSRLVSAIESSAEGVILSDETGRIVITNTQVSAFFPGLTGAFDVGAPLPASFEAALAQPTGEMRLADGRWLRLSRSSNPDGGFVVIASDITGLKDRERVLQAAKEEAELASRSKSEFLANMSHELRTPLNAVIGFSEIMVGEMFGPMGQAKYKGYALDILRSGQHLLDVINDILDIAKLQSGKAELNLRPTRLSEIVEDSMRIIAEQAKSGGIEMTRSIDPDIPVIEADATRLRQLLLNLLSNAIKFTPEGGRIAVAVQLAGDDIQLAVSDTGIGMAAKDIPKALEPFSQIDASITRKYGGTGLGLPLSKLFAELHGGRLTIESAVGRGTTVTVTLPVATRVPRRLALAG
jgi:signal transduction histidine kinase/HAMP domain-containing protein